MKKILSHLSSDWYKYLLELIVITAGILGAFALNNWNEESKENESEKSFLLNLKNEVENNQVSLNLNIKFHREINYDMIHFLTLTGPEATETDDATLDSLVYSLVRLPSFDPVNGNLTSAKLDAIEDEILKNLIAEWSLAFDDYKVIRQIIYDLYYNFIYPELSQYYQLKNIRGPRNPIEERSKFRINQRELLRSPVFENHLTMKAINANSINDLALKIHLLQTEIIQHLENKLNQ